jgi:hypothetical protein
MFWFPFGGYVQHLVALLSPGGAGGEGDEGNEREGEGGGRRARHRVETLRGVTRNESKRKTKAFTFRGGISHKMCHDTILRC